MPRKSIFARIFDALKEVLAGIRDVIVVVLFGREALSVTTPTDDNKLFEHSDDKKTSLNKEEKNKVKERKRDTSKQYSKIKGTDNLNVAEDIGSHRKISFHDANRSGGTFIGSKSTSIENMSFEEATTALSNELINEYLMNPTNGAIEVGGRYFTYFPDNERIVGNASIRDIILVDDLTGTNICSMTVSHYVDAVGEIHNEYKLNDFTIQDMQLFKETSAASRAQIVGQIESDIIDVGFVEADVVNNDVKSAQPKTYQEFMSAIKDMFGATSVYMRDDCVYCHIDTSFINPELPEAQCADYKINANGIIFAVNGGGESRARVSFLSDERKDEMVTYIQQHLPYIINTDEYKIYNTLSQPCAASGHIGEVHYCRTGDAYVLTHEQTGKAIGIFEDGEIRFTANAETLQDAMAMAGAIEKIDVSEVVELIQQGNMAAFETAIRSYSEEDRSMLKSVIDFMYYSSSRADRENFDAAISIIDAEEIERYDA